MRNFLTVHANRDYCTMLRMKPFRYGCVVGGENFCPRPELERQLKEFASFGPNARFSPMVNGERMYKRLFIRARRARNLET